VRMKDGGGFERDFFHVRPPRGLDTFGFIII
jgi:hypothetical protein